MYKSIKKRDGRTVKFDRKKIEKAIEKAGLETGEFDAKQAVKLTDKVLAVLENSQPKTFAGCRGYSGYRRGYFD